MRLDEGSPLRLEAHELAGVFESAETVLEENTSISGMVRVLQLGKAYLVQERTPDRQLLVRPRPTLEAATAFVEKRLQTYEKMWDG